jgi:hypothetical protein
MISGRRVGVSILDEEGDGDSGKGAAQAGDIPSAAKDHSHHNGR